ncbi:MAG: xylulokinase, partial [Anaerolineae bacterium]|nr:xylulokinase [Anaerolineae bacterium]
IGTDFSDAAGSGIYNVQGHAWGDNIVAAAQLPGALLPKARLASDIVGELQQDAAEALGLRAGIPVVAGCGDQPAQAVANGLIAPGVASVSIGSGGQVFIPVRSPDGELKTDPRCHVFNHAIPDMFFILSAILSAGLSLRWLRGVLQMSDEDVSYTVLNQEAAQVAAGADGLIFQPYLYGERTPHMDAYARGSFIGLSYYHTRGHLARAVMEGVAFAMRQALDVGLSISDPVESVIGAGGGMQVPFMRQLVADVLGLPVKMTPMTEHAGVGAAWLAGIGAGVYRDAEDASARNLVYETLAEPDSAKRALYDERFEQFKALYPLLRDEFHRLSGH